MPTGGIPDDLLACPVCRLPLSSRGASVVCGNGHAFDIARQGYVNLLGGGARPTTADTPAMIEARESFLGAGFYEPIADLVATLAAEVLGDSAGLVVDVGAGTGYYLAAVLEHSPRAIGLALDISKHAARHAARAHPRIVTAVCDAWGPLPLPDARATLVMSVFAPRNAAEFARILAPGGALLVVTPAADHLDGIARPLGMLAVEPEKEARLERTLGEFFTRVAGHPLEYRVRLGETPALSALLMGPSARHVDVGEARARISRLALPVDTRVSVNVSRWSPIIDR